MLFGVFGNTFREFWRHEDRLEISRFCSGLFVGTLELRQRNGTSEVVPTLLPEADGTLELRQCTLGVGT